MMAAQLQELSAIFDSERFRFENADGDVVIGEAKLVNGSMPANGDPWITIKGKADLDELRRHQTYRFYGRFVDYTNRRSGVTEKQFAFNTFVEAEPHGREGIVAYLKRAGEGNNIGQATAKKIYDLFGAESVKILREDPQRVADKIKRLTLVQCEAASEWLTARAKIEDCTIELTNLLHGRGFPKTLARSAMKKWGNKANETIRRNPYCLIQFDNVGFKRCDQLYLSLGYDPAKLRRQAFCIWHSIASSHDGHTWFPVNFAINQLSREVGSKVRPAAAIKMARRLKLLTVGRESNGAIVETGGNVWLAEYQKEKSELIVGELVAWATIESGQSLWPNIDDIENIDEHQREALSNAISGGPIGILGGGPGTGKTFTGANLIKAIAKKIGYGSIAVGAPTGKAAVRITEVMDGYGIPIRARTWHSMLMQAACEPWTYKVLIGDETSMNDSDLMAMILKARSVGCHVLLIGDINQLPPVGHGAPLRDMIAARVPYGELTEIKRNSGGIVETCAAIRKGESWIPKGNLQIRSENKTAMDTLAYTLNEARLDGLDVVWDCQVLTAVNEKSPVSRSVLNRFLQEELNGDGQTKKNSKFRVHDKVVNLKNSFFPIVLSESDSEEIETNDSNEAYVANGELAKVLEVHEKFCVVEVQSPKRTIRIPVGSGWDLGYALSCHKSQGSEWPVVIVMIDDYPGAKMVCDRSWIYTAISRAKDKCILIGKKSVAGSMCRRNKIQQRKTFLRERIELERVKMELVKL